MRGEDTTGTDPEAMTIEQIDAELKLHEKSLNSGKAVQIGNIHVRMGDLRRARAAKVKEETEIFALQLGGSKIVVTCNVEGFEIKKADGTRSLMGDDPGHAAKVTAMQLVRPLEVFLAAELKKRRGY